MPKSLNQAVPMSLAHHINSKLVKIKVELAVDIWSFSPRPFYYVLTLSYSYRATGRQWNLRRRCPLSREVKSPWRWPWKVQRDPGPSLPPTTKWTALLFHILEPKSGSHDHGWNGQSRGPEWTLMFAYNGKLSSAAFLPPVLSSVPTVTYPMSFSHTSPTHNFLFCSLKSKAFVWTHNSGNFPVVSHIEYLHTIKTRGG